MHLIQTIDPTPPFDFVLSSHVFTDGDPHITHFDGGTYRRVLRVGPTLLLARIASTGSVETPRLRVTLTSDRSLTDYEVTTARSIIRSLLNADLNVSPFYTAISDDPVLSMLARKLRGLKNPVTETVFEALVDSIIEQQISLNVAHLLQHRVIKAFGEVLRVGDGQYYAFPTPERLAAASIDSLRRCGLSRRKAEYITENAELIAARQVDLEGLQQRADSQSALDLLCALRGVGAWTAELTALRGLNRLDVIPADDLGLRRWVAQYYCSDKRLTSTEVRDLADRWGDWKGLAGYYLVIAGLLNIPPPASERLGQSRRG
ncbi:MAG: DNA-3-methyladenine glycosylase family protein [Halobacteriota archaeon]